MSEPHKHHYIPTFYLKNWSNADDEVCEMRKFPRNLSIKHKSPKATGFADNLYRIEGLPEEEAQQLESVFLSLADNDANLALRKLLGSGEALDARERSGWSRFIASLIFRNPQAVQEIKNAIVDMWKKGTETIAEEYAKKKQPGDPETAEEYFELYHKEVPHIDAANFIRNIIDAGKVAPTIFAMDWSVIDLKKSDYPLLTSDRPLHMPNGLGNQDSFVAMPIGQKQLFLAATSPDFKRVLRSQKPLEVVKRVNKATVKGAREYVWGGDETQAEFVRKHLASLPDRILVSEDAKAKALSEIRSGISTELHANVAKSDVAPEPPTRGQTQLR